MGPQLKSNRTTRLTRAKASLRSGPTWETMGRALLNCQLRGDCYREMRVGFQVQNLDMKAMLSNSEASLVSCQAL